MSPLKHRIGYLDAFRGLAILMVVGYHVFVRWPHLVPYGAQFAQVPLFRFGWLGVPLFFLISGFVILMTLEACDSVGGFLYRRWLRLFPAMLVCSALIYVTAAYFVERPAGAPTAWSLLPGLLFVEPEWLAHVLGRPIVPLEGVFWSLYVEFKFYVIAALLFFHVRRDRFVHALALLFGLYVLSRFAGHLLHDHLAKVLFEVCDALSFEHFGWFAAGAAYYLFTKGHDRRHVIAALVLSALSSVTACETNIQALMAALLVAGLFALAVVNTRVQQLVDIGWLRFVGGISYPLYLMHENMMIAMIVKMGRGWPGVPVLALPAVALLGVSTLAYLVAHHAERPVKTAIDGVLRRT